MSIKLHNLVGFCREQKLLFAEEDGIVLEVGFDQSDISKAVFTVTAAGTEHLFMEAELAVDFFNKCVLAGVALTGEELKVIYKAFYLAEAEGFENLSNNLSAILLKFGWDVTQLTCNQGRF
jgi:hypothetical protein